MKPPIGSSLRQSIILQIGCLLFICAWIWLNWNLFRVWERNRRLHEIPLRGGSIGMGIVLENGNMLEAGRVPRVWAWLGAKPVPNNGHIIMSNGHHTELAYVQRLFPEVRVSTKNVAGTKLVDVSDFDRDDSNAND
jgi:hypothetical protein